MFNAYSAEYWEIMGDLMEEVGMMLADTFEEE
jgi:hypothetical protein